MDKNACVCARTAICLWAQLRSIKRPRLDQCETVPQTLARRGTVAMKNPPALDRAPGVREAPFLAREITRGLQGFARGGAYFGDFEPMMSLDHPVDLLVLSCAGRRNSKRRRCHVWDESFLHDSLYRLGDRAYLCSPELAFAQCADEADGVELALLGYELCGFYATRHVEGWEASRCQPLMSVESLECFAQGLQGARGIKTVRHALRLMVNGSASVAETATIALLCFPRSSGGYGLPIPELNGRIEVPERLRSMVQRTWVACDAYWSDARFALEYDGRLDHEGEKHVVRDYARASCLTTLGIRTETITRFDLFDVERFDKVARRVAYGIGYELFSRDYGPEWHQKRKVLRSKVLGYLFKGEGPSAVVDPSAVDQ